MTPQPQKSTLATLLAAALKEEKPAEKLNAFCEVWKELYDDLAWIQKFDNSAVSENRKALFGKDLDGLISQITESISKKAGPNEIITQECERIIALLPSKINGRDTLAIGLATRTAANTGAIYSQLTTLRMLVQPKRIGSSSFGNSRTKDVAKRFLEAVAIASTATFTAVAVVDEGVTHAQHLVPILIEIAQEALSIELIREIVIEITKTIGMGMTF